MLHWFCIVDFILNVSYKCKYVTSYTYQPHSSSYISCVFSNVFFPKRIQFSVPLYRLHFSINFRNNLSCLNQDFMTTWSLITLTCWISSSFTCMDKSLSTQADRGHILIHLTDWWVRLLKVFYRMTLKEEM